MVHHTPPLDASMVIGQPVKDEVTKCFLSVFVLKADEIQMTLFRSKCEELNKHTQSYVTQFLYLATWHTLSGIRPFVSWYLAR